MQHTQTSAQQGTRQRIAYPFFASKLLAFLCLVFSSGCEQQRPAGSFYTVRLPVVYSYYNDGRGVFYRSSSPFLQELNATCTDVGRAAAIGYEGLFGGQPSPSFPLNCPTDLPRLQNDIAHFAWDLFSPYDYTLDDVQFKRTVLKDEIIVTTMEPTKYASVTAIYCRIYW